MTEQTECRWQWTNPDKPGLWWFKGSRELAPRVGLVDDLTKWPEMFYSYIGPIPPEPLPPKRKVTQTLWMVPIPWTLGDTGTFTQRWLSPDDTIPPRAIETVQKREVEA